MDESVFCVFFCVFFSWTRELCSCISVSSVKMDMKMSWKPVGSHLFFFFFFFPGGCLMVESDVPQPDFKHDVFIGSAQQLTKHLRRTRRLFSFNEQIMLYLDFKAKLNYLDFIAVQNKKEQHI